MTYNPELISFSASDGLNLPGLFFKPSTPSRKVVVYLHGNGSNSIFYKTTLMNALAQTLNDSGTAFFPFNNRGAHYIKTLKRMVNGKKVPENYGMTYELIKECIYDIDGVLHYLTSRGYTEIYLAGSSTGANKIVLYNYNKPDNISVGYFLLSGGDDTGLYYSMMGAEKFHKALQTSKRMIADGKGKNLVSDEYVNFPLSYQSMYDTLNPDGDYNIFPYNETMNNLKLSKKELFREFYEIEKPVHVIYGQFDEYCYGDVPRCVDMLKKEVADKNNFTFTIIPDGTHGFDGKESELATEIVSWITNLKK